MRQNIYICDNSLSDVHVHTCRRDGELSQVEFIMYVTVS